MLYVPSHWAVKRFFLWNGKLKWLSSSLSGCDSRSILSAFCGDISLSDALVDTG